MGDVQASQPTRRPGYVVRSCSEFDTAKKQPSTKDEQLVEHQRFSRLVDELQSRLSSSEVFLRKLEAEDGRTSVPLSADERADSFEHSTALFNSAAPLAAWMVVRPRCAEDVVRTIRFCIQHELSPSIRSGGYNTAGWSIQGDVVLDMRAMSKISVVPHSQCYTSRNSTQCEGSQHGVPQSFASDQFGQEQNPTERTLAGDVCRANGNDGERKARESPMCRTSSVASGSSSPSGSNAAAGSEKMWKRGHKPAPTNDVPGVSSMPQRNGLILPASGGFVWTADSDSGDPFGTARPIERDEVANFGNRAGTNVVGSNWGPSSDWKMTGGSASIPVNEHRQGFETSPNNSPRKGGALKPGIHRDQFIYVECEPGVGARELDSFTDDYGRAPTHSSEDGKGKQRRPGVCVEHGGVPYHVPLSAYPVGSTAMTIGGFGYLSRAYGLSLDNLVELDIVLADARLVTVNAASASGNDPEAAEIWWAVRGAAPCFGVVTRMVVKAYAVPRVYAGNLIYPFNPATASSLIRHWRDCLKGTGEQIPRELYSNLILTAGPPGTTTEHVIVIQVCYLGTGSSEEAGHSFVQAVNSWTGERVLLKDISEKTFLNQQDGVAQVLKSGQGRRWMVRGDLLTTLTDEVIAKSVKHFCAMGNRAVWLFELVGGAIADNSEREETCVGAEQRKAKFTAAALQQWSDREEDVECVNGVETWISEVLSPVSVGGPYAAFLERGESRSRCEGSFGKKNFERLLRLKKAIDPTGLFRHTFGRGLTDFN